jgi:DNA-3-methyladenine glycosylase II
MTQAKRAEFRPEQQHDIDALAKQDKKLGRWISKIGPIALPKKQRFSMVDALARSILYQQLNGKAAETIIERLSQLAGEKTFSAGTLARLSDAEFRSAGVSGNKTKALKSLAEHALGGLLPDVKALGKMRNDDIIAALTPVRGIGRWTVEMLLIFRLGRSDVLPVDDFGVRRGIQIAHGLAEMPAPKSLHALGEKKWAPHLTLASLYFWRIADLSKNAA